MRLENCQKNKLKVQLKREIEVLIAHFVEMSGESLEINTQYSIEKRNEITRKHSIHQHHHHQPT